MRERRRERGSYLVMDVVSGDVVAGHCLLL